MAKKLTLEQQIQNHINDPELRHLLKHSSDFAGLLEEIENTYSSLQRDLRAIRQTLDHRSRAYDSSQKLLRIQKLQKDLAKKDGNGKPPKKGLPPITIPK